MQKILVLPLHIAMWSLVVSALLLSSLRKRDKPRQEKGCKDPPDGYITGVKRRENGSEIHTCPRHG